MSSTTGNERRTVQYSGRVQGVGFRYTARSIALQYKVNGYVQNLDDGRVRLVVEGAAEEINRFLAALAETMARYIHDVTVVTAAASGEFDRFEVRSTTN
jgi:acylphosphatase